MVIIISPQAYYLLRFFHKKQTSSKTKKASGSLNQTHYTPDKAQKPIRLIKLLIYFLKELSLIKKKEEKKKILNSFSESQEMKPVQACTASQLHI